MKKAIKAMETMIVSGLVTLFSVTCIFSIIWMIYSSLKTDQEFSLDILSPPEELILDDYARAVEEGNIGSYFVNNMFDTLITVAVMIVIAFVVGCCLSRSRFGGGTFVYYMLLSGVPILIYALLTPTFMEFRSLGLLDRRYTSILSCIAFVLPATVSLVESSVVSVPIEIEEVACIDGNSLLHTMFAIVVPICRPVLSASAILTFLNTWNESPPALMLIRSNSLETMPTGLTDFVGSYTVNYPLMLVALMVSILPVVIMYLLFYNQIMKGMAAGVVKGQDRPSVLHVRQAVYNLSYMRFQRNRKMFRDGFTHL